MFFLISDWEKAKLHDRSKQNNRRKRMTLILLKVRILGMQKKDTMEGVD
jgi:hypothetical protein